MRESGSQLDTRRLIDAGGSGVFRSGDSYSSRGFTAAHTWSRSEARAMAVWVLITTLAVECS